MIDIDGRRRPNKPPLMLPSEIVSEIWGLAWASGCVLANLTRLCNQSWHLLHHSDSSYKHIVMSLCSTDKFSRVLLPWPLVLFLLPGQQPLVTVDTIYDFSSPSLSASARQDRVGAVWHKQPPQVHRPAHQPDAAQNQQNQQGGPSSVLLTCHVNGYHLLKLAFRFNFTFC